MLSPLTSWFWWLHCDNVGECSLQKLKCSKKKVSNLPSNDSRKKKILFALYLNLFYKFEILNFFIKIVKTNKQTKNNQDSRAEIWRRTGDQKEELKRASVWNHSPCVLTQVTHSELVSTDTGVPAIGNRFPVSFCLINF